MELSVLIAVLVIFLVALVCCYLVDMIGLPVPGNQIAKVIIVIIALVAILKRIPGIL